MNYRLKNNAFPLWEAIEASDSWNMFEMFWDQSETEEMIGALVNRPIEW